MRHKQAISVTHREDGALVSKAGASRILGISQVSVRRLVRRGVLEEVSLGPNTRPRIRRADVLDLVRGGAKDSP